MKESIKYDLLDRAKKILLLEIEGWRADNRLFVGNTRIWSLLK
jgi:hypothetical protein